MSSLTWSRAALIRGELPAGQPLIVLDEIFFLPAKPVGVDWWKWRPTRSAV